MEFLLQVLAGIVLWVYIYVAFLIAGYGWRHGRGELKGVNVNITAEKVVQKND